MVIIEIRGYDPEKKSELKEEIDTCILQIGLENEVMTNMVSYNYPESCDGKKTPMPYLQIFSSDFKYVPRILCGFEIHPIAENVAVVSDDKILFFSGKDIPSGKWKTTLKKKIENDENLYSPFTGLLQDI